ncbi:hypothetical protein FEM48_Zijuj09G0139700 [Ziziphus jujuba var. spinosa]|uniref:Uncharacterized protein n=1 Tax=Ziziphus jujuba var. spinosa TaxID=714518 RepID=A0A978UTD5_ZIZJJ|nr:hypothetical protein FEM48_Zijuj09G0139700 [Ziziphus jujuba var. spinosa]
MHWLPKHGKHHQPELMILPNLLQDQRLPYFPNRLHIHESHTIFRVPPFVHDPNDACNAACLGTCGEAGVVEEKEVAEFHGLEVLLGDLVLAAIPIGYTSIGSLVFPRPCA